MLQGWVVITVALAYIGLLFLVASYGDSTRGLGRDGRIRLLIYPLSLAIYCTSWTFFGSVGSASRTGYEFLTIYIRSEEHTSELQSPCNLVFRLLLEKK